MVDKMRKIYLVIAVFFCTSLFAQKKPNVLFIAVDDLNDWIGTMGGRDGMKTPNLDALAAQGMLFTNAHCSSPSCNPSRASIMTGVRPSTSGIYNNNQEWRTTSALANAVTIPEFFRKEGYAVKGGGKIFHGLSWTMTTYGKDQNDGKIWDEYFPSKTRSFPDDVWPETAVKDSTGYIKWDPVSGKGIGKRPPHFFDFGPLGEDELTSEYKVVDWAIQEVNKKQAKPLFLAVGLFRPHIPWFVPQKYFDMYPLSEVKLPQVKENDLEDVSPVAVKWLARDWHKWLLDSHLWEKAVQAYEASISYTDAMLGRLIDGLKKSGKMNNTIIVLWSDHGMHIGEKQHWEKFTLWEESTRVPMIIVAPGITKPNTRSSQPVSLLDIYPTLVDMVGAKVFSQLEGKSLKPLLLNPSMKDIEPAITTWHYNNHAVRTERWRYIKYVNGDEELYDHQSDANEFYNIAKQPGNRSLMDSLQKWIPKINAKEE